MNLLKEPFVIDVDFDGRIKKLKIFHQTETFDFKIDGKEISILNNGDNSWSIVTGLIDQEEVNLIGSEIEKHHKNLL